MKQKMIATLAVVSFFAVSARAFSADEHQAEDAKQEAAQAQDTGGMGMTGAMNMHGMMQECMSQHKNGKMCEHDTMEKCQQHMKKADCAKMMKETKTKEKKNAK